MTDFNAVKALLHNSNTFYLIAVTMDSTYGYVNTLYQKQFESQYGNLVGQHYSLTIHEDDLAICGAVGAQCFAEPKANFPATIRKHDGKGGYIATQWDYRAMLDEQGNPLGIFCIGYDITSFMQKSAALHQMEMIQSHVIRKPIANLVGLIDLLKTVATSPESAEILTMVNSAVGDLDHYTKTKTAETVNNSGS